MKQFLFGMRGHNLPRGACASYLSRVIFRVMSRFGPVPIRMLGVPMILLGGGSTRPWADLRRWRWWSRDIGDRRPLVMLIPRLLALASRARLVRCTRGVGWREAWYRKITRRLGKPLSRGGGGTEKCAC